MVVYTFSESTSTTLTDKVVVYNSSDIYSIKIGWDSIIINDRAFSIQYNVKVIYDMISEKFPSQAEIFFSQNNFLNNYAKIQGGINLFKGGLILTSLCLTYSFTRDTFNTRSNPMKNGYYPALSFIPVKSEKTARILDSAIIFVCGMGITYLITKF